MKKYFLFVLYFLISVFSKSQFRKYSNEFLNIGAGARALGMGSVGVASVNDVTAGYWNPAGLVHVNEHPSFAFMHAEYFAGIGKYDYAAVAIPMQNKKRTLGISLLRFAIDDIPNTLFLIDPDGRPNYNNIQTFSSADYAALFSFAQKLKETDNKFISFGINAKVIYRKIGSFASAWGFGIDAGIQYKKNNLRLALMAKDVTTTFNAWAFSFTEREKEVLYLTNNDVPTRSTELTAPRLIIGGAYDFKISSAVRLTAEANVNLTFDGKRNTLISSNPISADPNLGLETSINEVFFVRGGIYNFQRALKDGDTLNIKKVWIFQPSVGAGFKLGDVTIDYAYNNLSNQSSPLYTHVFSFRLDLKKKKKN